MGEAIPPPCQDKPVDNKGDDQTNPYQVDVIPLDSTMGKKYSFKYNYSEETTIAQLTDKAANVISCNRSEIILVYNGKVLNNEEFRRLREYNINAETGRIFMKLRMRGGMGKRGASKPAGVRTHGDKEEVLMGLYNDVTQKQVIVQDFNATAMTRCGAKVTTILAGYNANPTEFFNTLLSALPVVSVQKINDTLNSTNNQEQKIGIICKQIFHAELSGLRA